jgi:hypothetical protein
MALESDGYGVNRIKSNLVSFPASSPDHSVITCGE